MVRHIGRELTLNERIQRDMRYEEAKAAREVERSRLAEIVAETVSTIWESCAPASEEHPYLKKGKGVLPHGERGCPATGGWCSPSMMRRTT